MNYSESLHYLNSFLNLERIVYAPHNRLGNLRRMRILLDWAGHTEKNFFSILIAGTKGKGSTGFFLESILKAGGIRTGFYSSPHLEDPRERIRINGRLISKEKWAKGIDAIRRILSKRRLNPRYGDFTYFEIMTLLAIQLFREEKIKIGIFEIGMGGRLDATNVLPARLVAITPIHLDHEAFLGNTVAGIAREKAAVIHGRADVVVSPQSAAAFREIKRRIVNQKALLWRASKVRGKVGLAGDFQKMNAGAAVQMARILGEKYGFPVSRRAIQKGLQAKDWPARMEILKGKPDFLLDAAHNPAACEALVRNLKKDYANRRSWLIFGVSRDKKSGLMLQLLSRYFKECILAPLPNPRNQEMAVLLAQAGQYFQNVYPAGSIPEALRTVRALADSKDIIAATGSFYLVGEIRKALVPKRFYA
ncbi:MAG: bifunctional folylpolyglutamate synthase/dihydrofolate synthase [Candidatus Omnitrophica bacterium]|nr:bifunctional folylpolyglutamate synthase/dihydrofolate synthase [Candidatus Omnitrophota bacterium]